MTIPQETQPLAECPFCGSEASTVASLDDGNYIECNKCGATADTFMGWNMRVAQANHAAMLPEPTRSQIAMALNRACIGDKIVVDDFLNVYRDILHPRSPQ